LFLDEATKRSSSDFSGLSLCLKWQLGTEAWHGWSDYCALFPSPEASLFDEITSLHHCQKDCVPLVNLCCNCAAQSCLDSRVHPCLNISCQICMLHIYWCPV